MLALVAVATTLVLAPTAASAATPDPNHVSIDIQGCRLAAGETLPNASGDFICADGDYTSGNLGKLWNELDLVPHRLIADNHDGDQTYAIAIAADNMKGGSPGYDVISAPVVTSGPCTIASSAQGTLSPGVGGTDSSIYRTLTITQPSGSTCVFDYYERLALGSHLYPGSSLHSNLLNQSFGTGGVGAQDISIPVNEIEPQTLGKTMSASQGSSFIWNVTKDSTPTSLDFTNTCGSASSRQGPVTITVTWTKSAPAPNGDITLVTNITLGNPAHRVVTADVNDTIYTGTTQTTAVTPSSGSNPWNSGNVNVPAGGTRTLTHTVTVAAGTATQFNDVATATYHDLDTGIPVPGNTTASATATVQSNNASNGTATISDVEQITGTGLSFSLDSVSGAPAGSSFSPAYTLGTHITGPLNWSSGLVTSGGQVVFHKTVYVDQARNTTGTLSDTATLNEATGTHTSSASTTITARACLQGHKFEDLNANGQLDPGEPGLAGVTIYVDLNDNGTLDPGEPSAVTNAQGDYSIANVPDGDYTIREVLPTGYVCSYPSSCSHDVTIGPGPAITGQDFGNYRPATVSGVKWLDVNGNGVRDGGDGGLGGFTFYVDYNGNGQLDAGEPSAVSAADGTYVITGVTPGHYFVREVGQAGYVCTSPSPCRYDVTLASGQSAGDRDFGNFHELPGIAIDKTGPATATAGDLIAYTLAVTNTGNEAFADGNVVVTDPLCQAPPVLVSKNGDATPATLDPGETWTYTCSVQTQVGQTAVHNVGQVTGSDGTTVTATDDADTTLTQPPVPPAPVQPATPEQPPAEAPAAAVLGASVTPGAAKLHGPTGCVPKPFYSYVTGQRITRVRFYLDGRLILTLTRPNRAQNYRVRINPRALRVGVHRLVTKIDFAADSQTKSKTLTETFHHCARAAVAPDFTG